MPNEPFKITIKTDMRQIDFGVFRAAFERCITAGIKTAAQTLLKDARPYVPMLTGRLRDSGHLVALEQYAFQLIWDAANPTNDYKYARIQYEKVLQHVDGRYACKWIDRVMRDNPDRYVWIANQAITAEMQRLFGV